MELVERLGGIGKIKIEGEEKEHLEELLVRTSSGRIESLTLGDSYPQYQPDKRIFRNLMQKLFPAFELKTTMDGAFLVIARNNDSYRGLDQCKERVIDSRLFFGREPREREIELRIIMPKEEEYYMTMVLPSSYHPDAVDDLVNLLGAREKPAIVGAAPIMLKYSPERPEYGLADVPALGKILQLYQRAAIKVDNAFRDVGISPEQLGVLRHDSLGHENIAVRELSAARYQKVLRDLVLNSA